MQPASSSCRGFAVAAVETWQCAMEPSDAREELTHPWRLKSPCKPCGSSRRVSLRCDNSLISHPGSHTTMTPILRLDLGKFKSVACLYDPDSTAARFTT